MVTSVSAIPRARTTQRLASAAVHGSAPAAIVGYWWLQRHDLVAETPLLLLGILLTVSAFANLATSAWLRSGPTSRVRIHARVAVSVITTGAIVYSTGWGPLLLVAFAVGSAELLRTAGPETTGPNMMWNVLVILAGQIAIETGLVPTIVGRAHSHAIAVTGLLCLAVVTRVLGDSVKATDHAEAQLRRRAEHFEALIEHAADMIAVISPDGRIVSASAAARGMIGIEPDDLAGRSIASFLDDSQLAVVVEKLEFVAAHIGVSTTMELTIRHRDGTDRLWAVTMTLPSEDWDRHVVVNIHDITTQKDLEEQLRHDATHDALTGLLNRKAFGHMSELACHRGARTNATIGMLYVDLDGFKQINDSFGHEAGDRVLVEAGRRLVGCVMGDDTVARLGGDEFAVLLESVHDDRAIAVAEKILFALGQPITGIPDDVRIGASIGIALRSSEGIEISTLMRDADAAMYHAKRNGRARWELVGDR